MEKRTMLLLFPLLVIPFLAFGFYALGGGSGKSKDENLEPKGINTVLPDAQFKDTEPAGKMELYKQAVPDSNQLDGLESIAGKLRLPAAEDAQTKQINDKLAAINREIATPYSPAPAPPAAGNSAAMRGAPISGDVDRLESLMKTMQENSGQGDPEMAELNSMMDKILDIQNPGRARQRESETRTASITDSIFRAIPAVISTNQRASQGSVVELRLLDSVRIAGQLIPKGHLLFGLATFSNQRLNLEIKNIRLGTSIIPVNLTVFDQRDGMTGINAPQALLTEALGAGASDAAGSFGISGFDLTSQIAGAGLDAARSLFNKKVRRVKQKLIKGYPLLLRDNTRKTAK